jgi:phage gp29-like protein
MGIVSSVRGFFSRAPAGTSDSSSLDSASVLPDLSLWEQFQRIGGSLKPSDVSAIIRDADTGDMARLVDLSNEMRQKDGHLQSVLQTRETALAGLDWELVFPGESKRQRKSRVGRERGFVDAVLRNHTEFDRLKAHLAGAPFIGYGVAETNWARDGARLVPAHFELHSPRRFGFRSSDGRFVYRDGTRGSREGTPLLETWPDKFILSQPRVNGDVPCREGLVRVLMWLALFRNWSISDLLKLAEMTWKPWRRGIYDKSSSDKDIEALKNILRGMTSSGVAVYPKTVEVITEWAGGAKASGGQGGGSHQSLFELCGREMSKAVLGQTLTTEQGSVGSQALGNVHNAIRKDILVSDAKHLAEVLTHFLIEPMIRLNFGPSAAVPRLRFLTEDHSDMVQVANALDKLTGPNVRLKVSQNWARDELGIPDPAEGDELCGTVEVDLSGLDTPDPSNDAGKNSKDAPAGKAA